jgi:hypothetical protein
MPTLKFKYNFSRPQLLLFAIVFGLVGILIWKSLAAPNPALPGDLNNDNTVNIQDLSIMLSNYGTSNSNADINSDGTVNVLDMSILLSHYGQSVGTLNPVSTLANNATISGTYAWQITTNIPEGQVEFFFQNASLGKVSGTTIFTYNLNTTQYADGAHNGGYWIYDTTGAVVYKSPSISFTVQNGSGGTGTPGAGIDILTRFENNLNSDFGSAWGGFQPCIPTSSPSTGYPNPPAREGSASLMLHTETGCKANGGTSSGSRASTENHIWTKAPYYDAEDGYEFWYGLSVKVPAGQTTSYVFQEWHAGQASVNFQAPWHLVFSNCNGSTCLVQLTLNAGKVDYCSGGNYDLNVNNGWEVHGWYDVATIPEGQWNDLVWFVRWRDTSTGRIIIYNKTSSQTVFNLAVDSNSSIFHNTVCWQAAQNKIWTSGIPTRAWYPGGTTNAQEEHYPALLTYPSDTAPAATTYFDLYARASNNPTTPDPNPGKSSPGFQQIAPKFGGQ